MRNLCVNIQTPLELTEMVTPTIVGVCLIVAIVEFVEMTMVVGVHIVFLATLVRSV
jgi:hypothetical protein